MHMVIYRDVSRGFIVLNRTVPALTAKNRYSNIVIFVSAHTHKSITIDTGI